MTSPQTIDSACIAKNIEENNNRTHLCNNNHINNIIKIQMTTQNVIHVAQVQKLEKSSDV